MPISCNYPEAYLTGTYISNNITVYLSSTRTLTDDPNILLYSGPANISVSGFNLEKYFVHSSSHSNSNYFVASSSCIPNDGNIQLFQFESHTYSLPDNPYGDLHNSVAMDQFINSYRITNITLNNFLFINIVNSADPLIYLVGNYNSEGYTAKPFV